MYGKLPTIVGKIQVKQVPDTYILYLPVKLKDMDGVRVPDSLEYCKDIINLCLEDMEGARGLYCYLSVETGMIKPGVHQKRPGWHTDGFNTPDINYIYHSTLPTIFNCTKFNVPSDHYKSMKGFIEQALPENDRRYDSHSLLKVDRWVVHKTPTPTDTRLRTFIKVSFSPDKYNLEGNHYNPLLDYKWKMYPRQLVRNHPQYEETDSVPDGVEL